MNAELIDGRAMSGRMYAELSTVVSKLKLQHSVTPGLAVVLVGDDPASDIYVQAKIRRTTEIGMISFEHRLPKEVSQQDLLALVDQLNRDASVHGILVQLPLPAHLDATQIINALCPSKDVDGFHVTNAGKLSTGQEALVPCTPKGCMMLLRDRFDHLTGKTALVIGHSNIVGRPMAQLLLNANCTVMVTHKHSTNIPELARFADIVVVAVGVPGLVKASWIKPGATVIDVGVNRVNNGSSIVGDVAFSEVAEVAGAISPVPGGVGPMTIACLLANTLAVYCHALNISQPNLSFKA